MGIAHYYLHLAPVSIFYLFIMLFLSLSKVWECVLDHMLQQAERMDESSEQVAMCHRILGLLVRFVVF